ncbi:T9SS type A sorting domain-containing protein [Pelobium manganitolerans]|uniref:T9SS type A sorting domain-containing protein n=1 Tax=Pelobium manganitolerans TaxID=1842495 RepID=UPI003FA34CCA
MKHNYFSKHGLMLAVASVFSLNALAQTYTWTGASGDNEYTTLGNWDDGTGVAPTDIKVGTYQIPAGIVVNQTTDAVASGSSNLSLTGVGATLNLQKGFLGTNLNMVNGSVLNIENTGTADATLVNLRNGSGNYLAGGTINVGTPAGTGSKAIFAAKSLIAVGNGTDNVNVMNVYANGGLDCGSNNLLRIHYARDNGSGTVNVLGAAITVGEIQVGENTGNDIGSATLNLYSGTVTATTLGIPRGGIANANATNRVNIMNGILTVATNLQLGTYGKLEFKLNSDNSAPTGKLIMPTGTKIALQEHIDAGRITKPAGYDWVWDETAGVKLSVIPSTTPVDLISFNVTKTTNGVIAKWVTASEKDNKNFVLEHSVDGKLFTNLSEFSGKNGQAKETYSYIHESPANGTNYYRLSQVDFDGKSKVLGLHSVKFELSEGNEVVVYPNPATDVINISVPANQNVEKTVTIFNSNGAQVFKSSFKNETLTLNVQNTLSPGVYVVKVAGLGFEYVKKVVVQ